MLAYDIIIKFYDDEGSFLGISFQIWTVIGSIFLPFLLFFVGLLFSRLSKRNSERKMTASLTKMLQYIFGSQINSVKKQGDDLKEFAKSIYHQKSIPNAVLPIHAIKISEIYQFDKQESARLFIENTTGDKLSSFKTINSLFHDINYLEKNTDQILKVYNDFLNDLTILKEKWNTANNNLQLVRSEIVRLNNDPILILAIRQSIMNYSKSEQSMVDYYNNVIIPIRQLLDNKFRTVAQKSVVDIELYNALNGVGHVYLEFDATKKKYFTFFNIFKRIMYKYAERCETNKSKIQKSKVKFYV